MRSHESKHRLNNSTRINRIQPELVGHETCVCSSCKARKPSARNLHHVEDESIALTRINTAEYAERTQREREKANGEAGIDLRHEAVAGRRFERSARRHRGAEKRPLGARHYASDRRQQGRNREHLSPVHRSLLRNVSRNLDELSVASSKS